MPEIVATYEQQTVTGFNAGEREADQAPSISIYRIAPVLAKIMDELKNEGERSAYACAEADALAQILTAIGAGIDYKKIVFSRPNSDAGVILWEPCKNCSAWLVKVSGSGTEVKYKLAEHILNKLCPPQTSSFDNTVILEKDWPTPGQPTEQRGN